MVMQGKSIFVPSPISGTAVLHEHTQHLYQQLFTTAVTLKITGAQLYAPFDGYISQVDLLNFSLRFTCLNGLQFWFRIGRHPAKLHTQGCQIIPVPGKKVTCGTLLMQLNLTLLKQVDVPEAVIVLINGNKLKGVEIKKARQYLALEDTLMLLEV